MGAWCIVANFADDLGAAIVTTINGLSSAFSALGNTGGTLHAEYAGQDVNYNRGASGNCLVRPGEEDPVEGTEYTESCQSIFPFTLDFGLVDVNDANNARTSVQQAMRTAFRDRGTQLFANLTDNGSNRLGSSGYVRLGQVVLEDTGDPDRPRLLARLEVKCWVKLAAA